MVRNLMGYRPDSRDPRDFPAAPLFKMARAPETASDLIQWRPPIRDQLSEGSCTTFGSERAVRTVVRRDAPQFDFEWNCQQLYNSARTMAGTFYQDAGLTLRDLMKCLQTVGVGHDDLWPYDPANLFVPPPQEVLDDATQYRVLRYHAVSGSEQVRLGIASGFPVILGIALYESWYSSQVERNGILPMPQQGEPIIGYHCMTADAYNVRVAGHLEVCNQYGPLWGDDGVCHIPYAYCDSPANVIFAIIVDVFGSQAEFEHGTAIGQRPPR